jgi:hypothetical protein
MNIRLPLAESEVIRHALTDAVELRKFQELSRIATAGPTVAEYEHAAYQLHVRHIAIVPSGTFTRIRPDGCLSLSAADLVTVLDALHVATVTAIADGSVTGSARFLSLSRALGDTR